MNETVFVSEIEATTHRTNELISAVMKTDEQNLIFERWLREHQGLVFKVIHASTATPEDRNDLFQEMFQPETIRWDSLTLLLAASGWLYFGGKIYVGRKKQEQRERKFTSSLRDELDRDIAQVEYQISSRKHIVLGFIPPYAGAILFMWVVFRMAGVTEWAVVPLTAAMIGGLVLESRSQQRLVDHKLAPRKEELESLRDKLVAKEN